MREIGVFEAKAHFSSLLEELANGGEEIVITRHGKKVATLASHADARRERRVDAIKRIHELREEIARNNPHAPQISWEELIDEARR